MNNFDSTLVVGCVALAFRGLTAAAPTPSNPALNPVRFGDKPAGSPVVLVKDGVAAATIVIADEAWKFKQGVAYQAAGEFGKYVKLSTGAALPIASDATDVAGTLILVGESRLTREQGIGARDLPPEGFRVKTFTNGLAIVGWLPQGTNAPGDQGTLWGVYDVLERFLGIRFYHPGADGWVVPPARDLIVAPVHYTDFPLRIKRTSWPPPQPPEYRGGESTFIGHFCHTPNRFGMHFKEFPECFELGVDGKRNAGMPCYGNPKTVALMLQDLENFFKGDKGPWDWGMPTEKVYYISPPDAGVGCCCAYCSALMDTNAPGLGRASKLMAAFVTNMALEIRKRRPGMIVHFLPYANYTLPPEGVAIPSNVVATVCLMRGAANDKEPLVAADHDRMIAGWARLTGKPVRLWEYPCWPVDDTALPFQYPHTIQAFQRRHPKDIEGSFLCAGFYPPELGPEAIWMSQAPTFYCWFRLMWNPDFNVDAALEEYARLMFGPARKPMGAILSLLTDRWEKTRWQDQPAGTRISPRQVHEETMPRKEALRLRKLLAQARERAPEGTVERRRVDYFGKAIEVFLKESDNYHEGGKDLPVLPVLKVGGEPRLDGKLDEPCWKDAAAQPFKMSYGAKAPEPAKATTVQAVWTAAGVTFGFKLSEPELGKIKSDATRHDQAVFGDDCIEMFMDVTGERRRYYQIVANMLGTIYDGTAEGAEWNSGAKAAGFKGADFWTLEIFVPFSAFPEKPAARVGTIWYANFTRSRWRAAWELQRWSTLGKPSNHDFTAFGRLRFVE